MDEGRSDDTVTRLQAALADAQAAELRNRQFLADAAHQLRGPMAAIRVNAETILEGPGDDDRDRLLRNLVREVARGDRLVRSLLTMARLDEGQPVDRVLCDVVAICSDEVDRTWNLAPHLDMVVQADDLRRPVLKLAAATVREILANLLDNARRHAVDSVHVLLRGDEAMLEIRVVDDGPGMSPEEATRAFERFVSLDDKRGSGLGLPIARALAIAHGGQLSYENRHEGFVLRLPLVDEDAAQFDDEGS